MSVDHEPGDSSEPSQAPAVPEESGSQLKRLLYKLGIGCVIASFILPLVGIGLAYVFALPPHVAVIVSAVCIVGLPDILFLAGALLAGKEASKRLKNSLFYFYKKPVSPLRYYIGTLLFVGSLLLNFVVQYIYLLFGLYNAGSRVIYEITMLLNITMWIGFVIAGHIFWQRLKGIFKA